MTQRYKEGIAYLSKGLFELSVIAHYNYIPLDTLKPIEIYIKLPFTVL